MERFSNKLTVYTNIRNSNYRCFSGSEESSWLTKTKATLRTALRNNKTRFLVRWCRMAHLPGNPPEPPGQNAPLQREEKQQPKQIVPKNKKERVSKIVWLPASHRGAPGAQQYRGLCKSVYSHTKWSRTNKTSILREPTEANWVLLSAKCRWCNL